METVQQRGARLIIEEYGNLIVGILIFIALYVGVGLLLPKNVFFPF